MTNDADTQEAQEDRLDAWLALTGQVPAPSTPVALPLLTGSMAPTIPVGSVLSIGVGPGQACRAGEVAVFLVNDKLIAHRVLLAFRFGPWDWLLEKGDANHLGRWRRGTTVRGRVVGFTTADQSPQGNPRDTGLALASLRHHLRHWLLTLGRQRDTNANE